MLHDILYYAYAAMLFLVYFFIPGSFGAHFVSEKKITNLEYFGSKSKVIFGSINVILLVLGGWLAVLYFPGFTPPRYAMMDNDGLFGSFHVIPFYVEVYKIFLSNLDTVLFGWIYYIRDTGVGFTLWAPVYSLVEVIQTFFLPLTLAFKLLIVGALVFFLIALGMLVAGAIPVVLSKVFNKGVNRRSFDEITEDLNLLWILPLSGIIYVFEVMFFALVIPVLAILVAPSLVALAVDAFTALVIVVCSVFGLAALGWYFKTRAEVFGTYR